MGHSRKDTEDFYRFRKILCYSDFRLPMDKTLRRKMNRSLCPRDGYELIRRTLSDEMPLLGSALRGSSLLKSFSEATFLSKGFCLWSAMGLALSNGGSLSKRSQIGLFVVVVAGVRYYGLSYSTFSKCRAANRESLAMSPFLSSILWPILPKLVQAIS